MDEPIDRALAHAADGPEDGIDLDEVAATARHRRRRQRLMAGAGVVLVLLAVPVAAVLAWGEPGENGVVLAPAGERDADPPPGGDPDGADTPEGGAEVDLEVREEQVPRCGEVELRPRNTGEIALSYGEAISLQRWDGDAWRDVPALPPGAGWAQAALGVQPGEVGEWEQLGLDRFDPVEPGWYRLTKLFSVVGDDDLMLQPAALIEVVSDKRASDGDCAPSVEELADLDPIDEATADVTGDGRPDQVALHAHERGMSVVVETTEGIAATAWLIVGNGGDLRALGSRALPDGQAGLDLAGNGRDEVLVRREAGQLDEFAVLAWHNGDLHRVHQDNNQVRQGDQLEWILRTGADDTGDERHWLACTGEGVRHYRGEAIDDEEASYTLRTDTYRLTDGVANRVDQTLEHVDELPDVDEPAIDCDR